MATINSPIPRGLLAGSVTGLLAGALSIPLLSPDPVFMNSLTVVLGAFGVGIAGVFLHNRAEPAASASQERPSTLKKERKAEQVHRAARQAARPANRALWKAMVIGFLATLVGLVAVQIAYLDHMITFGAPLGAIVFFGTAIIVPRLDSVTLPRPVLLAFPVVVLAGGLGLQGLSDIESGALALDDLGNSDSSSIDPLVARKFTIESGEATYSVPETFAASNLATVAVGRTTTLSGTIDLDGVSEISIDLTTFRSDQSRRDSNIARLFAGDPFAVFTSSGFSVPEGVVVGEVFTTSVTGNLTIRGVTQEVRWDIEGRIENGALQIRGATDIVITDFGFDPPSIAGIVTVEDEARLEVVFSASPQQ